MSSSATADRVGHRQAPGRGSAAGTATADRQTDRRQASTAHRPQTQTPPPPLDRGRVSSYRPPLQNFDYFEKSADIPANGFS